MNQELIQLYVEAMLRNMFSPKSNFTFDDTSNDALENEIRNLESDLGKERNSQRKDNPEFQAAIELYNSPLIRALS